MTVLITTVTVACIVKCAFGIIQMNDTQTRTFNKYLGYTLSKISGDRPSPENIPQSLPIVTAAESALPRQPPTITFQSLTTLQPPASTFPPVATISPETANFPVFQSDGPSEPEGAAEMLPSATIGPPPGPRNLPSPFPTTVPMDDPNGEKPIRLMGVNKSSESGFGMEFPVGLKIGIFRPNDLQSLAQNIAFPGTATNAVNNNGLVSCGCVTAGTCVSSTGNSGRIDLRIVSQNPGIPCAAGLQYCCTTQNNGGTNSGLTVSCGSQNIIQGVFPQNGQASFGEFPWSGIILNSANQYVGGAALIDSTHLLTVAHLVSSYGNGAGLRVRLGEWDLSGTYEPNAHQDISVLNIVQHPSYVSSTLQNDLAVIQLASPVQLLANPTPQVNTACLPDGTENFVGQTCFVAGWGRESFSGSYQNVIKKVDVNVVGSTDCQQRLRGTKLGPQWNLDTVSFLCAGGESNRDACTGDGGNALVCLRGGRYVVAGITAAGVECGLNGVPGLYVNIANYRTWIRTQVGNSQQLPTGSIDPRSSG